MVARLRDAIQRGTTAAKPAATAVDVGTLYFDTSLDKLQRSSGTAWEDVERADAAAVGDGPTVVRKTADEIVNNSAALQNDDHLLLALAANGVWEFVLHLYYDSGTTPDIKVAFTVPAGATLRWVPTAASGAGVVWGESFVQTVSGTAHDFLGNGVGTIRFVRLPGFVANGATAGNLQVQWAQNTANVSDTTVRANSTLKAYQLV